jgi:seryl-tRNA synthetase
MDATTIDQEFEQLQAEFQDVAKTVQALAEKMQAAEKAGDANASEWLSDLKRVAQDIDDEQTQVKKLLLAVHGFVGGVAQAQPSSPEEDKPPLFAPGHEPAEPDQTQQASPQRHGMLGGMLGGAMGGGMMGGGMFGGYYGGGFGRAMEMGMAMNLGANLVSSIFR